MKRKAKPKRKIIKYTVLVIGALLLVSVVGLYQYNYYSVEKNRKLLTDLSEDMKALQVEFNKVQDGWTYDEYCRGMGSTLDRNNYISCNIILSNFTDKESSKNHRKYLNIIEESNIFITRKALGITNDYKEPSKNRTTSIFSPVSLPQGVCTLTDLDYSSSAEAGSFFSCSIGDAKAFHFRKE